MYPFINREHAMLELRVDELETRLAEMREELQQLRDALPAPANGEAAAPVAFGRRASDRLLTASLESGADGEQEGARLVVLEMLASGYTPDQIATYLRQTFAIDDPEGLIADAVPLAG